jgi:hypothetical protein
MKLSTIKCYKQLEPPGRTDSRVKRFALRAWLESAWSFLKEGKVSSGVLRGLIIEVDSAEGYARNDVRAKAKLWLIGHVSSLAAKDILLAEAHFGYLLPAGWGAGKVASPGNQGT